MYHFHIDFEFQAFKPVELGLISSHNVNLDNIWDMTAMRETGVIIVSTGYGNLYQISLQEGHVIENRVKPLCVYNPYNLLRVQVAGREYLAVSCWHCRHIKLMNLNKQTGSSSESGLMRYEMITAFSGEFVSRMCLGEENRLFVQSSDGVVLELDTSTTTFTKVKTISIGHQLSYYGLCYEPDPYRLLVVSGESEVRAVSCDNNEVVWTSGYKGSLLYIPNHDVIILARYDNKIVVLNPDSGSDIQCVELPYEVRHIRALCLFNNQIIMARERKGVGYISYFDLNNS